MKVVILAGGLGTRLAEETEIKPKPMVEIGEYPIIWHIMKHYSHYGFDEFVVALGYKGQAIKRFFLDYLSLNPDLSLSLGKGTITYHEGEREPWAVHLVDTGIETNTGGRLARLAPWLGQETFMLTYGDGVSNVDLGKLLEFHRSHGKLATITAVRPPARFGEITFDGQGVAHFTEKPQVGEGWINGGFMVLEPEILKNIDGDETVLEADTLEEISERGELMAYRHEDFWQCMDTLRDLRYLRSLWSEGKAPWAAWR